MTLKTYDQTFEVLRQKKIENRIAIKYDLYCIIKNLIKDKNWTKEEAIKFLDIDSNSINSLQNAEIEKLSIDFMLDVLERFGFKIKMSVPAHQQFFITISKTIK